MATRAWFNLLSELDHRVKTGPHSFNSAKKSARENQIIT
jgi:hypothetical protein